MKIEQNGPMQEVSFDEGEISRLKEDLKNTLGEVNVCFVRALEREGWIKNENIFWHVMELVKTQRELMEK